MTERPEGPAGFTRKGGGRLKAVAPQVLTLPPTPSVDNAEEASGTHCEPHCALLMVKPLPTNSLREAENSGRNRSQVSLLRVSQGLQNN